MLERWTIKEDSYLLENINKPIKQLSFELGRTIPSIKNRKKKLSLTINDKWSNEDISILIEKYCNSSEEDLLKIFPTRTWVGILGKAQKLKLNRLNYYHNNLKNHNLNILLEDKIQTYYYIGLLMADGHFNGRGIILSQTNKSSQSIYDFGEYINCKNIYNYSGKGDMVINGKKTFGNDIKVITAHDLILVPKIMEKFDIKYEKNKISKTYFPPNVLIFEKMSDELFLSFLIGFIDGDGSISKEIRNGNSITITSHINWFEILEYWSNRIEKIFEYKLSDKSLKKDNECYRFRIYSQNVIKPLKQFIVVNNLMVNKNKWDRING